jgi:catechol 2,3-dioxygenase-like lactoylglutathione lyase family enzyme
MLDHITLHVRDYTKSRDFYRKALSPLGYDIIHEYEGEACGIGIAGKPEFWITTGDPPQSRIHIAFRADNRKLVDSFYEAAIAAGGEDNGKPGLRPDYHPNYYGAFVIDPDGHNIEAVCHDPES